MTYHFAVQLAVRGVEACAPPKISNHTTLAEMHKTFHYDLNCIERSHLTLVCFCHHVLAQ